VRRAVRRTLLRIALALVAFSTTVPLALEAVFRFQLVDTYGAELRAYNPPEVLAPARGQPTLLAMGDSLTAGVHSYPALLRERLAGWRVINGGVPATGAFQAGLIADRRFERFEPTAFVYEVNVTNDLVNQRFPIDWSELPWARNLYWTLAHRLRGLEYLNYRSAQLVFALRHGESRAAPVRAGADIDTPARCAHEPGAFEPERYTLRERLYLRGEPALIENQVLLRGGRERDFATWIVAVAGLLARCSGECTPRLLVVPHASQVAPAYLDELLAVGARIDDPALLAAADYRFLAALREGLAQRGLGHVEILDALPRLRDAEAAGQATYLRYDPHLNACGQRVLADLVAESVLSAPAPRP
jgi:hypothetical protein